MLYTILVNSGYAINLCSLAIRDVLWLRGVMMVAQCILGYAALYIGNFNVFLWNGVFAGVNAYHVVRLLRERKPIAVPEELADIYEEVFPSLSRREFLYFWQMGSEKDVDDQVLVREGTAPETLMLMLSGSAVVSRGERRVGLLRRKSFIAEMSFLTREPASADVATTGPARVIAWEQSKLRALEKLNPSLHSRLQHILGRDLARKVRLLPQAA